MFEENFTQPKLLELLNLEFGKICQFECGKVSFPPLMTCKTSHSTMQLRHVVWKTYYEVTLLFWKKFSFLIDSHGQVMNTVSKIGYLSKEINLKSSQIVADTPNINPNTADFLRP